MPRTLDPDFITQKNAETNKPIHLYTVFNYDDASSDLTLCNDNANVTYDGVTYLRFVIEHESIDENVGGDIDAVELKIGNADRTISAYIQSYNWRGKKVSIKQVWRDELADTSAYDEDIYFIDNFTMDAGSVVFTLTSSFDIMEIQLPLRSYNRSYCPWVFKGTECKYAGGESECDRSWKRCGVLANRLNFGGMPSVPGKRIVT